MKVLAVLFLCTASLHATTDSDDYGDKRQQYLQDLQREQQKRDDTAQEEDREQERKRQDRAAEDREYQRRLDDRKRGG